MWAPPGSRRPVTRLVGRDRLVGSLRQELERGGAFALRGDAGIGKSSLLQALSACVELPVRWVGDLEPAAAHVTPLAPAHLLDEELRPDTDEGLLLVVDDLPRLTPHVHARLTQLREQRWCQVVVAGRTEPATGVGTSEPAWWSQGGWRSLQVPPLDRLATGELLAELLGDVVAPAAASAVHRASGGNPTGIVELAEDARELGSLVEGTDAWELVGPLPLRRLRALIGDRLVGLDGPAVRALEILALGTPMPIRIATQVLAPSAVRSLDRQGLVRLVGDGPNASVEMADPMVAEVVVGEMAHERRGEHLRALVAGFARAGGPLARSLRVASWRLETGGWDAAELEAAAVRAYAAGDHDLAEALAAGALAEGDRPRTRLLLAVTAAERGETTPGRRLLPDTEVAAEGVAPGDAEASTHGAGGDEGVEAWTSMARATVAAIGDGHWDLALDRLDVAAGDAGGGDRGELDAYRAAMHAIAGRSDVAGDLLRSRAARAVRAGLRSPSDDPQRRRSALALAVAQTITASDTLHGDVQVDDPVQGWLDREQDATRLIPLAAELIRATALLTDRTLTPTQALTTARPALEVALRNPGPAGAYWSMVHAWLHERAGELELARRRYVEAAVALTDRDPLRLRPRVQAGRAYVAASMGMLTRASMLLADDPGAVSPRVRDRRAMAQALLAANEQGSEAGATLALAAGDRSAQDGRYADALEAWHLAVRLGLAVPVADRCAALEEALETAADHPGARLVRAHAQALAASDPPALREVAMTAAGAGRTLVAAEVAAQAARLRRDEAMEALASGLAAVCGDADTPALAGIKRTVLTPRRQQAALLALRGQTGAAIAERLGVSVRTVENHLAAVYRTLGVRGRRELATFYREDRLPVAAG